MLVNETISGLVAVVASLWVTSNLSQKLCRQCHCLKQDAVLAKTGCSNAPFAR